MNFLTGNWILILVIVVLAWFVWRSFARSRSSHDVHANGGLNPGWQNITTKDQSQADGQKSEHKHGGCC